MENKAQKQGSSVLFIYPRTRKEYDDYIRALHLKLNGVLRENTALRKAKAIAEDIILALEEDEPAR